MIRPQLPVDMIAIKITELAELRRELASIKREIEARDTVIRILNSDLSRLYRKISHGCTDASCRECDQ